MQKYYILEGPKSCRIAKIQEEMVSDNSNACKLINKRQPTKLGVYFCFSTDHLRKQYGKSMRFLFSNLLNNGERTKNGLNGPFCCGTANFLVVV